MGEACFNPKREGGELSLRGQFDPAWFAVQTSYRCEQRVDQALTAKGFDTYLPLLREVHQWKDRKKAIDVPAFSGYLFVRCEPSLRNRVKVLETPGSIRLLGGNHAPSPVEDVEIDAVRRTLSSGLACNRCDTLTPSTRVRVMRGPLAGVEGRLVRVKSSVRLVITISVFSKSISAEVGLDDVEAIHDRSGNNNSYRE
jgi:transcription antitermination factor NusG